MASQLHSNESSKSIMNFKSLLPRSSTASLLSTPLYNVDTTKLTVKEVTELSYARAKAIAKVYAFESKDVLYLTDKFWQFHTDPIATLDGAAHTLLSIQYNLAAGTLASFAEDREELKPLLQKILNFEVSAQFMLSEVAHGLDAPNLETTCTLLPTGEFDLHTPHENASKWMPPTGPYGGVPRVAIVIARLKVDHEDRGVRPFIVALGNGNTMSEGVTSKLLPRRAGSTPVDHSITSFNHVRLPSWALLGTLDQPLDARMNFMMTIWRVAVGSIALSCIATGVLAAAVTVAARYSLRRKVGGPNGQPQPIIHFRTQQQPILLGLAQVWVLSALRHHSTSIFLQDDLDFRVRHGVATAVKATMLGHLQTSTYNLSERCGAQGLFEYNQITRLQLEMRGLGIAEGDVLALCIRFASELLLGRYELPAPLRPDSLLHRHEVGLMNEARRIIDTLESHRSEEFNRSILPLCQPLVEAIGHRMAYESALDAGVPQCLIDLYEISVIKLDSIWYSENAGMTRETIRKREEEAYTAVLPRLEEFLDEMDMDAFTDAPIVSDEKWRAFTRGLKTFTSESSVGFAQKAHL